MLALLLPLTLVVGTAGCTVGDPLAKPDLGKAEVTTTAAPGEKDPYAEFGAVQRVLDERARALLGGDRKRFLATVDRDNSKLRRRQAAMFDNLQVLPLTNVYYGVERTALLADPVRGGGHALRPVVVEHVQLRGVHQRPVSNDVTMTFVQRRGGWVLGNEREDPLFAAQFRPWYGTRIETAGDAALLVMTDEDAEVGADELLGQTRSALASVTGVLDQEPAAPLLVDATSNGAATEVSNASGEDAAAVSFTTFGSSRLGGDYTGVAGAVVKANPDYVSQLVEDDETLRHELTHYVLSGYGNSNPQWVTEGIAEYVGYRPGTLADSYIEDAGLERRIDEREVRLIPPGRWGDDPELDYLSAEAFAEFLISGYGLDDYLEMMDLFRRMGRSRSVVYGEGIVDDVLRRVYDLEADQVARGGFELLRGL
ncbi:hypothetical protein [Nocardioides plantarum]|uniref:hypothetical protein n=1 Tax=Nocardioides plantarum TaxID=29299 RepID=UPI00361086B3